MDKTIYNNEVVTETVVARNPFSGATVATFKEDYALSEVSYMKLKNGKSHWLNLAPGMFGVTLGYGFSLMPKLIARFTEGKSQVTLNEWLVFGIAIALSIVLYFVGPSVFPSDFKVVMKDIGDHFKNAPQSRQSVKRSR
jgi:hypothetical protein